MASAWAQLSKEDQAAFAEKGYTKKSYNDKYGKGGEPAPSAPSSTNNSSSSGSSNNSSSSSSSSSSGSSGNSSSSNRQDAVERSQSWGDLSKKEKRALQEDDPSVTKKSYNQSTGYRAEQIAIDKQDADPLNTKYSDMSDTYKAENPDKLAHKQARKDAGTYTNDRLDSYNVDSLDDFDITNTGRGRKEGENRLSVSELNMLADAGHSKEDIVNRALTGEWADAKKGSKAQALLDSWLAEFTSGGGDDPKDDYEDDDPRDDYEDDDPKDDYEDDDPRDDYEDDDPKDEYEDDDDGDGNDEIKIDGDYNDVIGDNGIINEDIGNTEITDSFNGGTIGDVTQGGTINGNYNTINNTVDNSNNSRYYGGDVNNMNIVYGNNTPGSSSGTWSIPNSPMSDLTMLGYGKPSDSPASSMEFVDRYSTMNKDTQEQYDNFGSRTAAAFIANARANSSTQGALDQIQARLNGYQTYDKDGKLINIPGTAQQFYNNSLDRQVLTFGEMDRIPTYEWNNPEPLEVTETDLEEVQEDAMDNL